MTKARASLVFFLVLAAAIFAVYAPALGNGLVFDDNRLTDGTIFGAYGGVWPPKPRLISYGSFVWVQALVGEGWWKQRLFNVVLHLATCWVVYLLLRELLERLRSAEGETAAPEALAAAARVAVLVFALNPMAVYAVAYLVQRSIVMATLFAALACWCWVRGLASGRIGFFAGALCCYLLALLSKETAVMTAALAVPLYVYVRRPHWKQTVAIVAGALALLGVAVAALFPLFGAALGRLLDADSVQYARQLEQLRPGITPLLFPLSILNEAALFFAYGLLWIFPNVQWMAIDVRPAFPLAFTSFPQAAGAVAFVAVVGVSAWRLLLRSDAWGLLGLCVLSAALLFGTEFATVWVQDPFVLYRSYLWAIFLPAGIALLLLLFQARTIYQIGVLAALVFAGLAVERNLSLKDEFSVWSDAAGKVDEKAPANALGRWRPFLNRGSYYLDREMVDLALADFARAEQFGETQGSARFSLGMALQLTKRHGEALQNFQVAENMGFQEAQLYFHRGESQASMGQWDQAVASYTRALDKRQDRSVAALTRLRRGEAAVPARNYDLAIKDFQMLLASQPQDERVLAGLGLAYIGKEDAAQAMAVFDKLLAARPSAAMGYYGRALAHVVGGNKAAGLRDLDQAIALDPRNETYRNLRARIAQK
ncbi:tetratricopeptide repeat protein [Caenimonas sedimenti]|uniref:Tetratricopeptide repeat protein n=1 Tax=Caenimonas sedimenti TaxID=2596921 RepID=A0A562ZIQ2_9BURK|nr:tetratricopeptide repeat protein [Caenimonas sedimenti]TWO68267.1 tetratricopeptide repeat protein [Caenimonas sedimenti]